MYIKHDYSYIGARKNELINNGFGKAVAYSLNFGRYFTEEEKQGNLRVAKSYTRKEWEKICDEFSQALNKSLQEILSTLCKKYDIHQVTPETSTLEHYTSDWDLFFWSNRGWNGHEYMDEMQISFNERRPIENREKILAEIIPLLEKMEYKNIGCRVQYEAIMSDTVA